MISPQSIPTALFLVFCRVGGCLMVAPGFSSERVPMRVRLFSSLAISITLFPVVAPILGEAISGIRSHVLLSFAVRESLIGVAFGLLARFFILALETLVTTVNMTIGLGNIFSSGVEVESMPILSTFFTTAAITLIFVMDLHLDLMRGLISSYRIAPFSDSISNLGFLPDIGETLSQAYVLALRITSPFLLFGFIVNLGFGFLARLTPQAPIYFISAPFMIVAGIYAMFLVSGDFLTAFTAQFGSWVRHG